MRLRPGSPHLAHPQQPLPVYTAYYVNSAFKRLQILRCTMHETRGFAFSPLVLSKRTSVLPSIPVVGYCNERRGKSETGQHRPAMVRSGDPGSISRANKLTPLHIASKRPYGCTSNQSNTMTLNSTSTPCTNERLRSTIRNTCRSTMKISTPP